MDDILPNKSLIGLVLKEIYYLEKEELFMKEDLNCKSIRKTSKNFLVWAMYIIVLYTFVSLFLYMF